MPRTTVTIKYGKHSSILPCPEEGALTVGWLICEAMRLDPKLLAEIGPKEIMFARSSEFDTIELGCELHSLEPFPQSLEIVAGNSDQSREHVRRASSRSMSSMEIYTPTHAHTPRVEDSAVFEELRQLKARVTMLEGIIASLQNSLHSSIKHEVEKSKTQTLKYVDEKMRRLASMGSPLNSPNVKLPISLSTISEVGEDEEDREEADEDSSPTNGSSNQENKSSNVTPRRNREPHPPHRTFTFTENDTRSQFNATKSRDSFSLPQIRTEPVTSSFKVEPESVRRPFCTLSTTGEVDTNSRAEQETQIHTEEERRECFGEDIGSRAFPLHVNQLWKACENGDLEEVETIFTEYELDVHAVNTTGYTALHQASLGGHTSVVEFLVSKANADPTRKGSLDWTPLHVAASAGHVEVMRVLMRHMPPSYWSQPDTLGCTPMVIAERGKHEECVSLLHQYGVAR